MVRENSRQNQGAQAPVTRLLINSRSDVAISCGADGVHLRSHDIAPHEVREIWAQAGRSDRLMLAISCHSVEDVARAASEQADFAVLSPIFEKQGAFVSPAGLETLREACRQPIPVIALGGITIENATACMAAGASGIAAIRLFQQNDIAEVVQRLRSIGEDQGHG